VPEDVPCGTLLSLIALPTPARRSAAGRARLFRHRRQDSRRGGQAGDQEGFLCSVGKITKVSSSPKNKGHVISQSPKPGKHLRKGTRVALKVGK
jgi:hypothetical protein